MRRTVSFLISLLLLSFVSFSVPLASGSEIGGLHYVFWNFPLQTFTKFSIDIEILNEPSNEDGLYYQMYQGSINLEGFYFGLQTRVYKPGNESTGEPSSIGKGLIFSRWGTRDLANVRTVEGGWSQSAGYEGDFVGVRRFYNWTTHAYRLVLNLTDTDSVGDWYEVWITDLNLQTTDLLGAIRFPEVDEGRGIANGGITWTELYSKAEPETPIPDWHISIIGVYAGENEISPTSATSDYSEIEHTDIYFDVPTREIHFVMGLTITRTHSAGILFSGLVPVNYFYLTRVVVGSGTTISSPSRFKYIEDTEVTVEALSDPGWVFDHWTLDDSNAGTDNPINIVMEANYTLKTIFVKKVLSVEGVRSWYWTDNTTINSVVEGDVDYDGSAEIVTGGYYFDGTRDVAQLVVWNGSTLTVDRLTTWYWTDNTRINSVAVGNLDEDEALEIVTGGYYFDGTRKVAQLVVWDGATLAVEGLTTWYWTADTEITSIIVEDIDGDGSAEIITGGYYNDGVRDVAQLVVWNATTFEVENLAVWYWTGDTRINSIDVENVDADDQLEIITGGYYTDSRRIAQLVVWDGMSLSPESISTWYWTSDTEINSVVAANVDYDVDVEIVTGGYYNDNSRDVAQLVIWSSNLQTVENLATWYWTSDTRINSITINDANTYGSAEIITAGYFNDLTRDNAQLVIWDATTLNVDHLTSWYWTSNTCINSVAIGNVDEDYRSEIITGGYFHDSTRNCAQTTIWEMYEAENVQMGIYPSGGVNIWDYESELNVEFNHILHYQKVKSLDYTKVVQFLDLDYEVILILIFEDTYANLQAIADGEYDSYLISLAEDIRNDGRMIWLRPMHEFNGDWYNWGTLYPGNNITDFIPAWKHVVQLFRDLNVPVKFQLNYNRYNGLGDTTPFSAFWPGDDYVDMAVITTYNRAYTDEWHQYWRTFAEEFDNAYDQVTSLTEKPIGVAEVSSTSYGGDKPQWIIDAFNSIAYDYPRVQQVSWFLVNKTVLGVEWDWDLNTQEEKGFFVQGMQLINTIRR